jgi:tRNA dimethylallyltransferase
MPSLLVICGPTASGKTNLGLVVAKKYNGEIVSADSRQVYKGMDIGTGKDLDKFSIFSASWRIQSSNEKFDIGFYKINNVKTWLLDIVKPTYQFNVADYVICANSVIKDIWKRGKLPIVVGGTGFWIKALIQGIETINIAPDWELRRDLNNKSLQELSNHLKKIDEKRWLAMNNSDRNNPRRLISAIEVKKSNSNSPAGGLKIDKLLMIGLKTKDYKTLYTRIDQRVDKRIKDGAEKEIKKLMEKYSWNLPSFSATGYRVWQDYFESKKTLPETIQRWKFDEHGLSRRQMTYFRKLKNMNWFDVDNNLFEKKIEKTVSQWYIKK